MAKSRLELGLQGLVICEQPCWESINDMFEFLKAEKGSRLFKKEGTVGLFMLLQAPTSIPHGVNLAAVVLLGQKSAQARLPTWAAPSFSAWPVAESGKSKNSLRKLGYFKSGLVHRIFLIRS